MIIFGKHDQNTLDQINDVSRRAVFTALMADGHAGYVMPIGGVAAYSDMVSVSGVGYDIGCGNAAIRTNIQPIPGGNWFTTRLPEIANEIQATISFGLKRSQSNKADDAPVNHPIFEHGAWDLIPQPHREALRQKARSQLGTVGSGNHYVDVLIDETGYLWVGVHFGSRGLGHTIASTFMVGGVWGDRPGVEVETLLNLHDPIGQDYWSLMELAGQYAHVGREWVARKVVEILGGKEMKLVHNHHNFAWRERHFDTDFIVVRKGATPAFPGQAGFVGGSMGDDSVILEGSTANSDTQKQALYSTVHGAGRVMSRTEARGKVHRKTGRVIKEGKVTPEMMSKWLADKGVILRGGGLDESPHAYRRLNEVLTDQGDTIIISHVLTPVVVVMAGANEIDPYKD